MNELSMMAGRVVPGAGATPGAAAAVGAGSSGAGGAKASGAVWPVRLEASAAVAVRSEALAQAVALEPAQLVREAEPPAEVGARVFEAPPTIRIEKVVESINSFLQSSKRALEFTVDENSGRTVITVLDAERKTVIRQIPPETALNILNRLRADGEAADTGLTERA